MASPQTITLPIRLEPVVDVPDLATLGMQIAAGWTLALYQQACANLHDVPELGDLVDDLRCAIAAARVELMPEPVAARLSLLADALAAVKACHR